MWLGVEDLLLVVGGGILWWQLTRAPRNRQVNPTLEQSPPEMGTSLKLTVRPRAGKIFFAVSEPRETISAPWFHAPPMRELIVTGNGASHRPRHRSYPKTEGQPLLWGKDVVGQS